MFEFKRKFLYFSAFCARFLSYFDRVLILLRSRQSSCSDAHAMRSPVAHTPAPAPRVGSSDAQENCAPLGAKSVANDPVEAAAASKTSPAVAPHVSRRALQPLDANRLPGSAPLKRKHRAAATGDEGVAVAARPLKQRGLPLSPVLARDRERENLAWLDMLVALLERKYGAHAAPLDLDALLAAKVFEPRRASAEQVAGSSSSGSRQQLHVPTAATAAAATVKEEQPARDQAEREKEARRQRLLLRHALQVQDSSVASSTCCGCKTGCLKMYVALLLVLLLQ